MGYDVYVICENCGTRHVGGIYSDDYTTWGKWVCTKCGTAEEFQHTKYDKSFKDAPDVKYDI